MPKEANTLEMSPESVCIHSWSPSGLCQFFARFCTSVQGCRQTKILQLWVFKRSKHLFPVHLSHPPSSTPRRHRFHRRCVPAAGQLQRLHHQLGRQVHVQRQRVGHPGDHGEGPALHHPLRDQHAAHRLQRPRNHLRYRLTDLLEYPDPRPGH